MTVHKATLPALMGAVLYCLVGCGPSQPPAPPAPPSTPPATTDVPDVPAPPAAEEGAGGAATGEAATDAGASVEGGWGDLTGRFVFEGSAPERAKLNVTQDTEFCTKNHPLDESLVVNPDNGGLANVVLWLYQKSGSDPVPVHDSYAETADEKVELDNEWCRFDSHVVGVRASQKLHIRNLDKVSHNTNIASTKTPGINPLMPAETSLEHQFTAPERLPVSVSCNIHPWMKGYVLVKDNPYFAVTDEEGKFEIKNLPSGEWKFKVWHEKPGYIDEVTRDGQVEPWSKGVFTITIKPGETNELGEVKVAAALFEEN